MASFGATGAACFGLTAVRGNDGAAWSFDASAALATTAEEARVSRAGLGAAALWLVSWSRRFLGGGPPGRYASASGLFLNLWPSGAV